MKRPFLLLLLPLLLCLPARAQDSRAYVRTVAVAPTTCAPNVLYVVTGTSRTYANVLGTCTQVGDGGGTPGGSSGDIQYNNAGAFGGLSSTGTGSVVRASSPTIVTPTIASFASATHSHQSAAGGGTLDAAAIGSGALAAARGGLGVDASACTGAFLWASGVPTCTGTTGSGSFVRATSPTFSTSIIFGNFSIVDQGASIPVALRNVANTAYVKMRAGAWLGSRSDDSLFADLGQSGEMLALASGSPVSWSSTTASNATKDAGLARVSAGSVKVTNGSTGYGSLDASGYSLSGVAVTNLGAFLSSGNGSGVSVSAGSTVYGTFAVVGNNTTGPTFQATESLRQMLAPAAATLRNFYVRTGTAQPGDGSLVVTVRVNGADTGLTITVAAGAGAGTFSDTTHTASVAAGDLISFSVVNNSPTTGAATLTQWAVLAR